MQRKPEDRYISTLPIEILFNIYKDARCCDTKEKRKTNLFYIFFIRCTLPLNQNFQSIKFIRNIVSFRNVSKTTKYRKRWNGSGYLSFPRAPQPVKFLAQRSRVALWIISWQTSYSSIFSLANFNESRIIEIPTISCNWQRIKLPHIRPSPRKRLLSLFLENMDENQTKDSTSWLLASIPVYFNLSAKKKNLVKIS